MKARDIMTRDVLAVFPDTPVGEIAQLLADRGLAGVPVVDDEDAPLGMVSERDIVGRDQTCLARDIMADPIITIGENTDVGEIAHLLQTYRVRQLPVVHDGRIVGIVSRSDLLSAIPQEPAPTARRKGGMLASAFEGLDKRFGRHSSPDPAHAAPASPAPFQPDLGAGVQAADFRGLVRDYEGKQDQKREQQRQAGLQQRQQRIGQMVSEHVSDQNWQDILHRARQAAANGEKEFLLLRFPSQLCSDRGRAIDVNEPDWPTTLRGEAAEIYLRWERELKPTGFRIAAQVVDYPGGVPGDVGLFLVWG